MSRLVISTATGASDPTRASIAFHIAANGAAPSGVDAAVILTGDAAELVREGVAAGVRGVGIPPLQELLDKCVQGGIAIHVWKGCAEARGVSQLPEGMAWIAPPGVVAMVMEADRTLSF